MGPLFTSPGPPTAVASRPARRNGRYGWSAATFTELTVIGVHQDTLVAWPADPGYDRLKARVRGRFFRTLDTEERRQHLLHLLHLLPPDPLVLSQ